VRRIEYVKVPLADNIALAPHTFVLRFARCEFLASAHPGQFVMLRGQDWGIDPLLPRAFSLLAVRPGGEVDILVKASGKASQLLERALPGAMFGMLGPLGNSFATPDASRRDWLVAGGVGLAPLMMHALRAQKMGLGRQLTMFYGGRSASDLVLTSEIAATGADLSVATEDGSRGLRGYVTAAVEERLDKLGTRAGRPTIMACGPEPMLEAVARLCHRRHLPCYLSLEGEMACGIGACLACAVPCVGTPYRYTCVHGPVMPLGELAGSYAAAERDPAPEAAHD
jgi:dihydroorotate dehydrogenase electron transfer subunit